MTRTRVALSRAWSVPPASLRDVTIDELRAMVGLINDERGGADA